MKSFVFCRIGVFALVAGLLSVLAAVAGWRLVRSSPTLEHAKRAVASGDWDRAQEILDRLTRQARVSSETHLLAAQVAAQQENLLRSLEHLCVIPANDPLGLEALLRRGQCLRELGYGRQAEDAWRTAVRKDPSANAARWELLDLYYAEYRLDDARALTWEVYEHEADKIPSLLVLLRFELERPSPHFGVGVVERFVANDPEDWDAKLALGRYNVLLGKPEGRTMLEECWKHQPDRTDYLSVYLLGLRELGEYQTLRHFIKNGVPQLESDADYWRMTGEVLEQTEPQGAKTAYERALDIDPYSRKVHFQLGRLLQRMGDSEAGHPHVLRANELHLNREALADHYGKVYQNRAKLSVQDCSRMGELTENLGHFSEAVAWHTEALRRDPHLPESQIALQRLHEKLKKSE